MLLLITGELLIVIGFLSSSFNGYNSSDEKFGIAGMIVCNAADDDFKKIDYVVKPLANQRMVLVGNSKKPRAYAQGFYMLAVRTGLEPATPGV
ncbi:hypothetical protein BM451_03365, partial [Dickeya dadantii]